MTRTPLARGDQSSRAGDRKATVELATQSKRCDRKANRKETVHIRCRIGEAQENMVETLSN